MIGTLLTLLCVLVLAVVLLVALIMLAWPLGARRRGVGGDASESDLCYDPKSQ